MTRWHGISYAGWFGLAVAATLTIVGAGIALASTNRNAAPINAPIAYSKQ